MNVSSSVDGIISYQMQCPFLTIFEERLGACSRIHALCVIFHSVYRLCDSKAKQFNISPPCHSYNRLQLPRIPQRILDRQLTNLLLNTFQIRCPSPGLQTLVREVDAAVFNEPAAVLGEGDDGAFAVEEEEVFGARDREAGIGDFAARGDFGAYLGYEDLCLVSNLPRLSSLAASMEMG